MNSSHGVHSDRPAPPACSSTSEPREAPTVRAAHGGLLPGVLLSPEPCGTPAECPLQVLAPLHVLSPEQCWLHCLCWLQNSAGCITHAGSIARAGCITRAGSIARAGLRAVLAAGRSCGSAHGPLWSSAKYKHDREAAAQSRARPRCLPHAQEELQHRP